MLPGPVSAASEDVSKSEYVAEMLAGTSTLPIPLDALPVREKRCWKPCSTEFAKVADTTEPASGDSVAQTAAATEFADPSPIRLTWRAVTVALVGPKKVAPWVAVKPVAGVPPLPWRTNVESSTVRTPGVSVMRIGFTPPVTVAPVTPWNSERWTEADPVRSVNAVAVTFCTTAPVVPLMIAVVPVAIGNEIVESRSVAAAVLPPMAGPMSTPVWRTAGPAAVTFT